MKRFGLVVLVIAALSFSGGEEKLTPYQYIELYKNIAVREMHRTGIPASITMAQGLLESGNGNSRLAKQGNNHFGIKCKSTWKGRTIFEDDDAPGECFRAYDSAYLSYVDHSEFLLGNVRYAFLFGYDRTDYKSWAHGLKQAGYATNPKYPELLIGIIERHELHKFDLMKAGDSFEPPLVVKIDSVPQPPQLVTVTEFNSIPATRVGQDEGVEEIARRNEMGPWQVRKYNDIPEGQELQPGEIIYLKPKRRKGTAPYHVVKEGETMWSISQQYGIKLKHLYRKNHLDRKEGEQPQPGITLNLQEKAPEKQVPPTPVKDSVIKEVPQEPEKVIPVPEPEVVSPVVEEVPEKKDPSKEVVIHKVQPGETLFAIAKKYNLSVEDIKELNGLQSFEVKVGQELIVNGNASQENPDTESTLFVHVVKSGETLYSIAKKYNMSVEALKKLNTLESEELKIGQKLSLSKPVMPLEELKTNEMPEKHTVEKGDTLYSIAKKYQISVDDLKRWNQLQDNGIRVGQQLRLKTP